MSEDKQNRTHHAADYRTRIAEAARDRTEVSSDKQFDKVDAFAPSSHDEHCGNGPAAKRLSPSRVGTGQLSVSRDPLKSGAERCTFFNAFHVPT